MTNEPDFQRVLLEEYAGNLKKFYNALVEEGFSEEQALGLVKTALIEGLRGLQ